MIPQNLLNKFTARAQQVMHELSKQESPTLVDFFLALHAQQGSLGSNFLKAQGIKSQHIGFLVQRAAMIPNRGAKTDLEEAIKRAMVTAARLNQQLVGTQHLLYGVLVQAKDMPVMQDFFKHCKKSLDAVIGSIEEVLHMGSQFSELYESALAGESLDFEEMDVYDDEGESESEAGHRGSRPQSFSAARKARRQSVLDRFGIELTALARKQLLDPLIGRDEELRRVIHILNRRTKSNPVLIGDPGVGKTAIANGLAYRIVRGDVPSLLADRRLYSLKMSSILSGTMFRGEFESKLEAILEEVKRERILLFIDELHTIIGAGAAQGSLDAANILKPALANGDIQVIGATTVDEYRGYIERDKALERRFQPIMVEEPDEVTTTLILQGLRKRYEQYHRLSIADEAIAAAVRLSARYIPDRFLPDKAIDLIDEAAARLRSAYTLSGEFRTLHELKDREQWLEEQKEQEIDKASYDRAFQLKKEEEAVRNAIKEIQSVIKIKEAATDITLTAQHIRDAVSGMTKIPVSQLSDDERVKLGDLEKRLSTYIVGQEEAIDTIARAVRRARVGLSTGNRPLGSYIFMGPSGVGKTELAKVLAREVFGRDTLIRLDMSEFSEPHTVARLLGAPAGYIGYGEGGQLTETIRRRPHSIVLFDEIEKGHPQIYNILLQILEDGMLTDAMGRAVSFKNSIIILTSNLGTQEFNEQAQIGFSKVGVDEAGEEILAAFDEIKQKALRRLKQIMKPELVNRIDEVIVFRPLTKKHISTIIKKELGSLIKRFNEEFKITLSIPSAAHTLLLSKCFKPQQGARTVRRVLRTLIEDPIARLLIDEQLKEGGSVRFRLGDEVLVPVVQRSVNQAKSEAVRSMNKKQAALKVAAV
ncbi:MAG: hypothetical protein A2666_00850 [Parcubacteria group bacterium RIFCSPHIGHO2_01_FULL_47_10b]|nr:MAG: hypothetical protein A2666_00850 [Parcubacteria group bacterium RIFCSPHIGHO2_01_FULL_47_10b]